MHGVKCEPGHPLTEKQAAFYEYLFEFTREHGFQPTLQEIADHFGWESRNYPHVVVRYLAKKGYVVASDARGRGTGPSRAVKFLLRPDGTQFRGFER